jgi:Uma2 family endonuclease
VEVLAHDDHPANTLEKVAHWLKAGVRLVWVVDADKRTGRVYRADGSESLLGPNDALDGEDVLPGFRCLLTELW